MTDSFTSCYSQERLSTHTAYDESPEERIKLSQYLNNLILNSPKSSESLTLDFSHKSVDEIDFIISSSFQKYQSLIGNSNYLTNLRHIEQFSALQKLSLADNEIEDLDNIYYLTHLPHLSELNLTGNPITEHSGYKDIVIMMLPNLNILDSEVITEDRRKQIPSTILANFQLLKSLLTKQLDIIKFESIINRLKVHQTLYMTDIRFRLNHIHFETEKCRQIVNLSHFFDESFRIWLRKNLLKSIKIDPAKAFASTKLEFRGNQLLFKQSQLLIKLLKDLERTCLYVSDLTKNSLNISDIRGTMDSKTESDSQSFYSLNMDGECWETCQSNDPNLMGSLKIPQAPEIISEKEVECSFNEMAKPGTPSFRLDISHVPENEEGHFEPSNISHVENSVWQDITIKHVTSSRDLPKATVLKDKEIQLKDLVLNTTEKNSAFKRRTIKNKERPSSRREYEAIIDIINKESSHVRDLEKQIQDLKEENYTLYEQNRGFKAMIEEENDLIQHEDQANKICRKRMIQQAFSLLRYSVKCSKEVKRIEAKVMARRRLQLENTCFGILARYRRIWKSVKAREVKSSRELLKRSFSGLKRVVGLENKLKAEREKRIRKILKECFGYWKDDYMKESSQKKEQTKKIQRYTLGKNFQKVKRIFQESTRITKRIQEIKKSQNNTSLKDSFDRMKGYMMKKKNRREKEQILTKKRLNNAWISWIVLEQNNRIAEELLLKQFRKNRLRRIMDLWKQNIQRDHVNKEFIEEKQRQRDRKTLGWSLGKLKENVTESLRIKYKESCEENTILKKKEEEHHAKAQNQESDLKRIIEEYTLKLKEFQQREQIWAQQEQQYIVNEALYKEKEALYAQKDQDYALIEEMYHQKDLEYLLRDQEWQTREELHKAREDMFLEREEALKSQEEALQARENALRDQEETLKNKEEELMTQEWEQNEQNKARDLEHAIREQELVIKEELFKTKQEEYERRNQEYIEKDLALAEREKENEIKSQEFTKKEENIMKKQINLVQIKKEAQELQMKNEEEYMKKEEEWALKEKEYALKEVLYAQKEEEIMKKDQENAMLSEKYNQLKAQYEEREALFLQVREEIQEACLLKEEEYTEKEAVLSEKIEEYAQKEDEYQRKIRNYQENEKNLEEQNRALREELQTVKQQYIESSNHQINASNAILEEMETYKQDLQAEKEAKEALFNEKESLTQEVTRLTEGKERQEIIIQELEGLCMRLQEALDAKSNNSAINSARKSQVLMQINEQEEEMEEPKVERDLNKELEGLEDESAGYDKSLQVEELLKNKLEESKREIDLPAKFLSTDPNSHYGAAFTTSQTEGDLREYIHILDFSRQKTEEGSLVYMGRPTFDPQSNSIGTTIKDLDEFEGVRTPANSGKIHRRIITRYNKENLLGSPPVRLVEQKEMNIKAEPQGSFMRFGRANSLPWNIEAGMGNPLGLKSPNMEMGAERKEVGKIKTNRKKETLIDPVKNIESLRRNTQSIYDEIQQKAKRRQSELRWN